MLGFQSHDHRMELLSAGPASVTYCIIASEYVHKKE